MPIFNYKPILNMEPASVSMSTSKHNNYYGHISNTEDSGEPKYALAAHNFYVVNEFMENLNGKSPKKEVPCECPKYNGAHIPVYGVILLSLTIILMFIVICCLCFIIYRMRNRTYREHIFSKDTIPITNDYVRQTSTENAESTSMKKMNFDSPFKSTSTLPIVEPDVKEKTTAEPKILHKPPRPEFPKPANGKKLPMQPVITPDQMNKVCVEVLEKMKRNQSTSLTHLNELMKHKDDEHHEHSKFEDNFEYDVLPRQEPMGGEEMYDCPQLGNSHLDDDPQDYYDNLPIREDTYANVKFMQGIHSNRTAL